MAWWLIGWRSNVCRGQRHARWGLHHSWGGSAWTERQGEEARRDLATLLVGGLLQAPASSSWDGPGPGRTEPYLGWAGLHFSPPEVGLWGLQDKEGVGR